MIKLKHFNTDKILEFEGSKDLIPFLKQRNQAELRHYIEELKPYNIEVFGIGTELTAKQI